MAEAAEKTEAPREESLTCPHCGGNEIIKNYQSGESTCTTCGRVIKE